MGAPDIDKLFLKMQENGLRDIIEFICMMTSESGKAIGKSLKSMS